jgi:hypothetical protein
MDQNQKKFIPQLAIDTEFFHSAFVKPCSMQNQRRSQRCALTAHLAIECLIANCWIRWREIFKWLSQDGGRRIFLKIFHTSLFNEDLSNEPNFGRIHLAGQYL